MSKSDILDRLERIMNAFTGNHDSTGDDWPTERRDRWVAIEMGKLASRLRAEVEAEGAA